METHSQDNLSHMLRYIIPGSLQSLTGLDWTGLDWIQDDVIDNNIIGFTGFDSLEIPNSSLKSFKIILARPNFIIVYPPYNCILHTITRTTTALLLFR